MVHLFSDWCSRIERQRKFGVVILGIWLTMNVGSNSLAAEVLRMGTTTSTDNSGLLHALNPVFERRYNVRLDVIAVGTGRALRLAENGDIDLLLVHAPMAEQAFMDAGFGVDRASVMHNDFVLLGSKQDPAGVKGSVSAQDALSRVARMQAPFVSRGDDSGTHKKENALWRGAGIAPTGAWYISVGQSMGAVLRIADNKGAYTLCDRGTYLAFLDKVSLVPVYEGSTDLYNPYHVMAVNPEKHPHVEYDLAKRYIEFLTGSQGQNLIGGFRKQGKQLFYPDAIPGKRDPT